MDLIERNANPEHEFPAQEMSLTLLSFRKAIKTVPIMWGPWTVNQSDQWTVTVLLIDFINVSLILNCVNVIGAVQAIINNFLPLFGKKVRIHNLKAI